MAKTEEELQKLKEEFKSFTSKTRELTIEELKEVTGGRYYSDVYSKNESEVKYLFNIGDTVEVYSGWLFGTVACRIVDRRIKWYETNNTGGPGIFALNVRGYRDEYLVQEINNHWYFYLNNEWLPRSDIEMPR